MKARRASGKQTAYIRQLAERVGGSAARRASRDVLKDPVTGRAIDAFAPASNQPYPWSKELVLDHLSASEATDLITKLRTLPRVRGRR